MATHPMPARLSPFPGPEGLGIQRLAPLLGAFLLALFLGACGGRYDTATIAAMDAAQARWEANPVLNYTIVVDVDRPGEKRRNTVVVQDGEIAYGEVKYWDEAAEQWKDPFVLSQEQAYPFTVPGLFDMVRGEIRNSGRRDIQVGMDGEPPFPYRIRLGPVYLDGKPFEGTEAVVQVVEFRPR